MLKFIRGNIWQSIGVTSTKNATYDDGFYFEDETQNIDGNGPYESRKEAEEACAEYGAKLQG